ncbi:MAG: hypothetical protein ABIX28_18900 [Vicinamibacterales bacterium]
MTRQFKTVSFAGAAALCAVLWPVPLHAQQGGSPARSTVSGQRPPGVSPQGFSVVLVVGDLQGPAGDDDVPVAARRALADMKDFLPYKSYKLVDAAWIVGTTHATSRLRGPEDRDYELEITTSDPRMARLTGTGLAASASGAPRVGVSFALRDVGGARDAGAPATGETNGASLQSLQREMAILEKQYSDMRGKYSASHPEAKRLEEELQTVERKVAAQQRQVERAMGAQNRTNSRAVINTSFTMDIGETVVVGTSRLSGNSKALIALLTAVPQKPSRR